jgi:type IV secretory pathway VirB2 component (pilin)
VIKRQIFITGEFLLDFRVSVSAIHGIFGIICASSTSIFISNFNDRIEVHGFYHRS